MATAKNPAKAAYAAYRINRTRATKVEMAKRNDALISIVTDVAPCTVRQVYYQATIRGVVDKTEAGYDKVQRALVDLRRRGQIEYRQITDNTRWQIRPRTFDSVTDALNATAQL